MLDTDTSENRRADFSHGGVSLQYVYCSQIDEWLRARGTGNVCKRIHRWRRVSQHVADVPGRSLSKYARDASAFFVGGIVARVHGGVAARICRHAILCGEEEDARAAKIYQATKETV